MIVGLFILILGFSVVHVFSMVDPKEHVQSLLRDNEVMVSDGLICRFSQRATVHTAKRPKASLNRNKYPSGLSNSTLLVYSQSHRIV
jgi:hypothetical protein